MKRFGWVVLAACLSGAGAIGMQAGAGGVLDGFQPPVFRFLEDEKTFLGPELEVESDGANYLFLFTSDDVPAYDWVGDERVGCPIVLNAEDGSIASDFGFEKTYERVWAMEPLSDGSMLICGASNGRTTIHRVLANGSVDPEFVELPLRAVGLWSLNDGWVACVTRVQPGVQDVHIYDHEGVVQRQLEVRGYVNKVEMLSNGDVLIGGGIRMINDGSVRAITLLHLEGGIDLGSRLGSGAQERLVADFHTFEDGMLLWAGRTLEFDSATGRYTSKALLRLADHTEAGDATFNSNVEAVLEAQALDGNGINVADVEVDASDGSIWAVFVRSEGGDSILLKFQANGTRALDQTPIRIEYPVRSMKMIGEDRILVVPYWSGLSRALWSAEVVGLDGQPDAGFNIGTLGQSQLPSQLWIAPDGGVWFAGAFNRVDDQPSAGLARISAQSDPFADVLAPESLLPNAIVSGEYGTRFFPENDGTIAYERMAVLHAGEGGISEMMRFAGRLARDGSVEVDSVPAVNSSQWPRFSLRDGGFMVMRPSTPLLSSALLKYNSDFELQWIFDAGRSETWTAHQGVTLTYLDEDSRGRFYYYDVWDYSVRRLTTQGTEDLTFAPIEAPVELKDRGRYPVSFVNDLETRVPYEPRHPLKVVESGFGSYLLLGDFSEANGHATDGLASFSADGTVDTTLSVSLESSYADGRNAHVSDVAEDASGRLYVVGDFVLEDADRGIACLDSEWKVMAEFAPQIAYVPGAMQGYAERFYPQVGLSDGILHVVGPYQHQSEASAEGYWQLEAERSLALPAGKWFYNPELGWTYGYGATTGYSLIMGTVYVGSWPYLYLYNQSGWWIRHVVKMSENVHYFYSPEMGWMLVDLRYGGWYQSSAHDWEWFRF